MEQRKPLHLDRLGKLCQKGREVTTYLHQVPDDESQWKRLDEILDGILAESKKTPRRELPKLAQEMKQYLAGARTVQTAELMQSGFDRMFKLWQSARTML